MILVDFLRAGIYNYVYGTIFQKLQVRDTPPIEDIGADVKGFTIIVTGPTSGIGTSTAAELARRGAHVVLACRSQSKGDAVVKRLTAAATAAGESQPSLEVSLLDLASLESVRQFVERWEQQQRPLHVLINNAGMFNMGVGRGETSDGIELHMQTNHLAHFLLTLGLMPALKRAAEQQQQQPSWSRAPAGPHASGSSTSNIDFMPRVVQVASAMHQFGYKLRQDPLQQRNYSAQLAYGNSKMAQLLFAVELNRRLAAAGIPVAALSLHPGNVMSDVVRSLPPVIQRLYQVLLKRLLLTPEQGARASLYAATAPDAPAVAAGTLGYINCNAKPVSPNKAAGDASLAAWLWQWSKEQVKLPQEWDLPPATKAS
jgi:NAD(P)-dependent dehydrogenase (short-subunit alcohol dehydrogenase family)